MTYPCKLNWHFFQTIEQTSQFFLNDVKGWIIKRFHQFPWKINYLGSITNVPANVIRTWRKTGDTFISKYRISDNLTRMSIRFAEIPAEFQRNFRQLSVPPEYRFSALPPLILRQSRCVKRRSRFVLANLHYTPRIPRPDGLSFKLFCRLNVAKLSDYKPLNLGLGHY